MKKIISFIAVFAMVSSLFVSVVSADAAPVMTTSIDEISAEDFYEAFGTDIPEGNAAYLLTVNLSGLGTVNLDEEKVGLTKKKSGRKICAFQYDFGPTDDFNKEMVTFIGSSIGLTDGDFACVEVDNVFRAGATYNSVDAGFPSNVGTTVTDTIDDALTVVLFVDSSKDVTINLSGVINFRTYDKGTATVAENYTATMSPSTYTFKAKSAPATVDVTSVTISGATAATVGDNVQLSATVLPDNATDKTVTWTKVSGNGAVSDSGVVTATAAGDVVVKATAGGVDSANYTVSFAAAVPADIVPAAADKDTYSNASTGLQDAFGNDVTIDSSRSYGAAKFENVVLDDGEYVYKVFATGTNKATGLEETKSWDVVDGSVELTGASVSFIAIVRSATHTITSVVLKAFAK